MVLNHKELLNYLHKIYQKTSVDTQLPEDWEVVSYDLLENKSEDASRFLEKKTKKPLLKV